MSFEQMVEKLNFELKESHKRMNSIEKEVFLLINRPLEIGKDLPTMTHHTRSHKQFSIGNLVFVKNKLKLVSSWIVYLLWIFVLITFKQLDN
jgi:hypothetical protein